MGKLAVKYELDLAYIFAVLKRNRWNPSQAELDIREGEPCQEIVRSLALEYKREPAEIRKLLEALNWNVGDARKFAMQHRSAWRLPDSTAKVKGFTVEAGKEAQVGLVRVNEQQKEVEEDNGEGSRKKFSCTFCSASFDRMRFFEAHMANHEGPKPFGCDRCSCRFTVKDHLQAHVQGHIDRTYACDLCSGRYSRRSHLVRHLTIHARHSNKALRQQIAQRIREISRTAGEDREPRTDQKEPTSTYKNSVRKAINFVNKTDFRSRAASGQASKRHTKDKEASN